MANIRPIRAIRYADPSTLPTRVTPPYDVIDKEMQDAFHESDPYNFIRIDLGWQRDIDTPENDRYTRARQTLFDWLAEGELTIDREPALYVHEQTFTDEGGETITRRGFFSTVELADYEEKIVLPHERTLKGPKIDRLNLMKATECQLSPVFFLYDDPESTIDTALAAVQGDPWSDVTTADGIRHVTWRVTDPASIETVQSFLREKPILIADGHHRYETALAYRDHRRETRLEQPETVAPYECTFGFFVNFRDPGLAVFGTHRAMHDLEGFDFQAFKQQLVDDDAFEILDAPSESDPLRVALADAGEVAPSFGVIASGHDPFIVRYVGSFDSERFDADTPPEVRALDVAVLHEVIIDRQLGVSKEAQEAKTNIHYIKGFSDAVTEAATDAFNVVFLMNATKVEQVDEVCRGGGKMPQKSTYFYPKVLSGLLINPA